MTTQILNINGISELDFTSGVSSVSVTKDVASIAITGGTPLVLQVNGTPNGDQALLNLASGTGIGLVDNGTGTVTISFTGGGGTVTHTGSLTAGQLIVGNAAADITVGNLTGDVTTSGSTATTVAKIDANPVALGTLGAGQDGYVMTWVNGSSQLQMVSLGALGGANASQLRGKNIATSVGSAGSGQNGFALVWVNGSSDFELVNPIPLGTSVAVTTASLANNATENDTLTMAKMFGVYRLTVSVAARVRLYQTSAARTADASRGSNVPPTPGTNHQVIGDWYLDGTSTAPLDFPCSPVAEGQNNDGTQSTSIYAAITNISGSTQAVTATIYYVPQES